LFLLLFLLQSNEQGGGNQEHGGGHEASTAAASSHTAGVLGELVESTSLVLTLAAYYGRIASVIQVAVLTLGEVVFSVDKIRGFGAEGMACVSRRRAV